MLWTGEPSANTKPDFAALSSEHPGGVPTCLRKMLQLKQCFFKACFECLATRRPRTL